MEHWLVKLWLSAIFAGVFFTVGVVLHFKMPSTTAEFFITSLSLIPTSILIQMSCGDILIRLQKTRREVLCGIFRTLFGSFPEFALATIALLRNDALLAQTSLIGAFLSNCLLLLGICFLSGGIAKEEMIYPVLVARAGSQLLVASLTGITLPTAFQLWKQEASGNEATSRVAAFMLLIVFSCYVVFLYITHSSYTQRKPIFSSIQSLAVTSTVLAYPLIGEKNFNELLELRKKSLPQPHLRLGVSIAVALVSSALYVVSSTFVVGSKKIPTETLGISKSFVGLVLLPLLLTVPEQVSCALSGKLKRVEWIIEEIISSCVRILFFILPVLVILGWGFGVANMTLFFDGFQVTILSLTVLLVNYLIHGNGTWFEGIILLGTYALFGTAAWNYPK